MTIYVYFVSTLNKMMLSFVSETTADFPWGAWDSLQEAFLSNYTYEQNRGQRKQGGALKDHVHAYHHRKTFLKGSESLQ